MRILKKSINDARLRSPYASNPPSAGFFAQKKLIIKKLNGGFYINMNFCGASGIAQQSLKFEFSLFLHENVFSFRLADFSFKFYFSFVQ